MPTRAPSLRAHGQRERKPWDHNASSTARGYGGRWRAIRADVLSSEPLCRACRDAGRVTAASVVDHIVPKAEGGSDEYANLQPLCRVCHDLKTAEEAKRGAARAPREPNAR